MTLHPRGLLVAASLLLLLWLAVDVRWALAVAAAIVVYDTLAFAGALGVPRLRRTLLK
jgi:hypothetical protein